MCTVPCILGAGCWVVLGVNGAGEKLTCDVDGENSLDSLKIRQ